MLITKTTITVRVDYEYERNGITHEIYREDSVVQDRERQETDADFIERAGIILEYTKARI